VSECEGEYQYEPRKNQLTWQLPLVDSSNKSGAMEFTCQGHVNDFFPINVSFYSKRSYADLSVSYFLYLLYHNWQYIYNFSLNFQVMDVVQVDDGISVKYAADTNFFTEKYEIL